MGKAREQLLNNYKKNNSEFADISMIIARPPSISYKVSIPSKLYYNYLCDSPNTVSALASKYGGIYSTYSLDTYGKCQIVSNDDVYYGSLFINGVNSLDHLDIEQEINMGDGFINDNGEEIVFRLSLPPEVIKDILFKHSHLDKTFVSYRESQQWHSGREVFDTTIEYADIFSIANFRVRISEESVEKDNGMLFFTVLSMSL